MSSVLGKNGRETLRRVGIPRQVRDPVVRVRAFDERAHREIDVAAEVDQGPIGRAEAKTAEPRQRGDAHQRESQRRDECRRGQDHA